MLVAIAIVVGTIFLWELLEGIGLVGWGLIEIIRQILKGD